MLKPGIVFLMVGMVVLSCDKVREGNENGKIFNTLNKTTLNIDGWEISKSDYDFNINSRGIHFINSDVGFVVGYNGDIYKTTDAGEIWRKQNSGTSLHLHSVFFVNNMVGFVSGQSMNGCLNEDCDKGTVFLKTSDGGETWIKTFFPDYFRISSLKFFDELKGIAIINTPGRLDSQKENIAITSDGGMNWNLIDLAIKTGSDKLFFVDNFTFVEGEKQKIFKSSDFGNTWETINTPVKVNSSIRNLYFLNEKTGIIDGNTDVFRTTDGGSNWIKINYPFNNLGTIHFSDVNKGFNIVPVWEYEGGDFPAYKGSYCYETKDGGENWTKSELITSISLGFTYFPERGLGYGFNGSKFYTIKRKD